MLERNSIEVNCPPSISGGRPRPSPKWHDSQRLHVLDDGSLEMHMKLSSLLEVQRWVLGWGGEASVIGPAELAGTVREAARKILGVSAQ